MHDILEHQQQNMSVSQKERSRDRAAVVYFLRGVEEKRVKRLVLKKAEDVLKHYLAKEGKGKGHRSRITFQRDNSAVRQYARKTGKGLLIHSLAKEEAIYNSSTSECCKSLSKEYLREALAIRNFQEHPLESRGKPRASGTIRNHHKRHSCAQT